MHSASSFSGGRIPASTSRSTGPVHDGARMATPTGRIEAMEQRLEATHGAALVVQPALTKFYDGLSDEQKARFNSLRADPAGTYPKPAAAVVDQEHSRPHERGKTVSSSTSVAPPQQVDEE